MRAVGSDSIGALRARAAMPKLTGGYFGIRGADMFSPYFIDSLGDGAFIDIMAGTVNSLIT